MAMSGSPLPEREGDSYFRIRFMVRSMCSPGSGSPSRSLLWIEPESYRAPLPSVPVMELVRGWNLACDVHDHGLALPALDQLLLAEISPQELFDKLHAAVFEKLRVGFQATVEGHRDFPWARKDLRILDRHLVMYGVTRNRREAFPPPKKLRQTWAALASSQHNALCDAATVRKTPQMAAGYLRHGV